VAERFDRGSVPRSGSRTRLGRIRAARAKVGLTAAAVVAFGASMLFARLSFAGAPKSSSRPSALVPPARFVGVVRQNRLQAGILAPAQAPPSVSTSTS